MNPRWRKVWRDLWGNKTRTLLVVLSIAVGVFAVGAITTTQLILSRDLDASYLATNPPSAIISLAPFDDELVRTIREMPEVEEADARRSLTLRIRVGNDTWRDFSLSTVEDFDAIRIDKVSPEAGAWPPPERGLLIERSSLPLLAAGIGDTVEVELPDGTRRQLRIAGTAHHLLQPPAQFTGTVTGYVNFDTMEWLGTPRNYTTLFFTVAERPRDAEHIKRVAALVRDKVERGGRTVFFTFVPTPGKHPADDAVQPVLLVLSVLGYLALAMSGFLVVNTITALLSQQVRQIGVMKAIGANPAQIMGIYFAMVIVFSLLSLLLAVPLGALGAMAFSQYIAGIVNFDIVSFPIIPEVLALELAVGVGVPLLASLYPIIAGALTTVREALSTQGAGTVRVGGPSPMDRLLNRLEGLQLFSRPVILSLRNTFRRRARLLLTLVTLTLGGAIFIAVFSVRASLFLTIDEAQAFRASDVEVRFSRPYRMALIEQVAARVPGVVATELWGRTGVRRVRPDDSESDTILLFATPAETSMVVPSMVAGRWLLPDDENAVVVNSEVLKEEGDLQVGDELVLNLEGEERPWRVVGIVKGVLAGPQLYVNLPYYGQVTADAGRANLLQVRSESASTEGQGELATALEAQFKHEGLNVSLVRTTADQLESLNSQFNILVVFLFVMAALISLVGGLGLAGTMSLNVLERQREIGVLRAIGASDRSVLQIFMVEGLFIGILSWVAGAICSLPLSRLLSEMIGQSLLEAPLTYTFPAIGPLAWLVGALTLATAATFWPARNASRLAIREILAYE